MAISLIKSSLTHGEEGLLSLYPLDVCIRLNTWGEGAGSR